MSKLPVSVYIICQNEAQHIRRVLESVKGLDEVIIVDSGSKDETLEIAKAYTDKIYHQEWLGFAGQKEYAKNLCSHEWVLNLDADEQLTPELKDEIEETMKENSVDGLDIRISSKYLGKFNHPLSKFNRRVRFFRKAKGRYPEKLVHESVVIDGKIKKAKGFIFDYGTLNLETHVRKINEYSSLRAEEKAQKGKKASALKLMSIFPLAFFKSYVIKRGFLNGLRGFIAAMNNAYYAFLKEAKLYEKKGKNRI
ncbi:glycosyltransferase family 2 protein [Sulfurovum sp.]|uniref:glycosyltransferase family 2 protein n=1 Tax=Sulfurovum sp. TaxID=1969726 RepID=UPI0025FA5081|nr:glycosyltransferase family 2 protein [Sulfurovum sp.]